MLQQNKEYVMLRKAITAVLVLGVSTFVSAGDNTRSISETSEVFIGAELGATMAQGRTGGVFGVENYDDMGLSLGLRLGAQNALWRSMVVVDYFDNDVQNYERAMIQVDYYVMSNRFNTTTFRPYIGLNGGYANYEATGVLDDSGFVYGGQIGFTASVSENIDLDVAYRHSIASPDDLDHIGNVVFGVNYLY